MRSSAAEAQNLRLRIWLWLRARELLIKNFSTRRRRHGAPRPRLDRAALPLPLSFCGRRACVRRRRAIGEGFEAEDSSNPAWQIEIAIARLGVSLGRGRGPSLGVTLGRGRGAFPPALGADGADCRTYFLRPLPFLRFNCGTAPSPQPPARSAPLGRHVGRRTSPRTRPPWITARAQGRWFSRPPQPLHLSGSPRSTGMWRTPPA